MTRNTWARIAGLMFLFYIATALPVTVLFEQAAGGEGIPAKLLGIAENASKVKLSILLSLVTIMDALVLTVALFAITRDQDFELAVLALCFRVCEGILGAIGIVATLGLLWLATTGAGTYGPGSANALAALLLKVNAWSTIIGAFVFAVGSTIFAWLFLRARSIPEPLAWLGILASVLLVALLPAQLIGVVGGPVAWFMWMPMLVFELTLALWLLIKGVAAPSTRVAHSSA